MPLSNCILDRTRNMAHVAASAVAQCLIEPSVQMFTLDAAAYDVRAKGMPRFIKSRCAERSTTTSSSGGDGECLSQTVAIKSELEFMNMFLFAQDTLVFVQNYVYVCLYRDPRT